MEDACRSVVALHATENATVHLAVAARAKAVTVADVDAALHDTRSIVKQLAMRRTLFAFPRDLLPAAWGSAAARVEVAHRRRVAKDVEAAGLTGDGAAWLEAGCDAVLRRLAEGPASTAQVRADVPEVAGSFDMAPGKAWGRPVHVAPWVLTHLDPDLRPLLFDSNGNAGTTAWWDGRVVGWWVQDPDGVVQFSLLRDVGAEARTALQVEADRLTAWLDGVVISNVYASYQMKQARLP